ncbi:EH signature domain-containing protein [Aliarcobacter cryaerophilus]|uniref:EH signature domain-containing protein n=1 Tax=Aliarcobacter cryaerophilus TaxID=28198 RepID=UPI0021B68179|nr:EH signature domain-containing protein [Aliarcobacter cryaerophilus]MCT7529123.1 EH signature domain-containing protein [Aliarcobacter cryaerophilus]
MIEVSSNPFYKISEVIKKYEKSIEYIASGGINRTINYQSIINNFSKKLENGLDIFETNVSLTELTYVANEMAINKSFIKEILEYDEDDFETILLFFQRDKKLGIYKNLLKLYFNHFSLLNEFPNRIKILEKYIKAFLYNYDGKNRLLNLYKNEKEFIFNPFDLLIKYQYNIDNIQKQFSLLVDYEYMLIMLNFKLVQQMENLEYDEKNDVLFSEIIKRKDLFFKDNFTLKEYTVKYLLTRVIKEGGSYPNWQQFILEIIGDPRSLSIYNSNRTSWDKIGNELKTFFIGSLSKEDLKLFLEQLSEKGDIKNYEYRKAFWMAFTEYVQFAKLIVGRELLRLLSAETQRKIKKDETCYATYNQTEQSAIYIDFGKIKIIEYTHNGSVRGYIESPIDLSKNFYTQQELIIHKNNVFTEPHLSPSSYNWQVKVLQQMNHYLGTNFQIEDIYIESDRKKRDRYSSYINTKISEPIRNFPNKPLLDDMKICKICGQRKNKDEFFNSKKQEYGYGSDCKECVQKERETNNLTPSSNIKMIKCNKCGKKKTPDEFRKNPKTSNGYTYWCISCMDKGNK